MTDKSRQKAVLKILSNWQGIESLKELFWTQLNYDRVNEPLSREDFPKTALSALASNPVLFASAGEFQIIYCPLLTSNLRLTDERAIVNRLLREHPYALFVFSSSSQELWHLVNVKVITGEEKETEREDVRSRRLLRRITIGPEERLRTASERIAMLDMAEVADTSPLSIQELHDHAFDVEKVTEAFFSDYQKAFYHLQQKLNQQVDDQRWAHNYALQLLNRIMFLYFIQRKRWLGDNPEFIKAFWDAYKDSDQRKDSFFPKWLSVLFFEAFNNNFQAGRSDRTHFPANIRKALAKAPYLNGGLFTENDLDLEYSFTVSDDFFETLFDRFDGETPGFLERYNFTISEDTPFDQEVAVDPVMIGKVYESLVNISSEGISSEDQRGTAGIFYTPRIEIDLMCRLALVDYLTNHVGEKYKNLFYEFVFAYDPDEKQMADAQMTEKNLWNKVDSLLRNVTVLDPACGSGSFLVGMLEVLDDLQGRVNNQLGKSEDQYGRRKRIIGQCLYGVDVMDWAVHIAELRLWLQLMIETPIHPSQLQFKPLLPNLSFKVRQGDSLVQEIGGLNFTLHRTSLELPSDIKGKITKLKGEKMNFYSSSESRSSASLKQKEQMLFREILFAKKQAISNRLKSINRTLSETQTELLGEEKRKVSEKEAKELEEEKQMLNVELERVKKAREALRNTQEVPFVWDIAFVEVFEGEKDGFDIVVGNPPYVRQELIAPPDKQESDFTASNWRKVQKEYKNKLRRSVASAYPAFFNYKPSNKTFRKIGARSDLYIYFYLHGLSLLNSEGSFCFITSNSWLDVGYGKDLQEFLLKKCHVKMILDNQAKRSFAQADVNTIIALFSPPDIQHQGFDKTARFVNFKVPFEEILSPIIFEEIEEANERMTRPEFRVFPIKQGELYKEGCDLPDKVEQKRIYVAKYEGDKWGGKYLRAPDIFFTILEKGKDKLVRLGDIAEVRRGFTTGANDFFYLDDEKIEEWGIEEEFLKPVIKSPRECKSIIVNQDDLKYKIFMCHEDKKELKGSNTLEYIEWGEEQGFHKRPSCRGRRRWYDLGYWDYADLLWVETMYEAYRVHLNAPSIHESDKFYGIIFSGNADKLAVSLNSSLVLLFKLMSGFASLGQGALKTAVYEVKDFRIPKPELVDISISNCRDFFQREIEIILDEIHQPDRRALDEVIFDALGLTSSEREAVYEAVVELVRRRLEKAKSV